LCRSFATRCHSALSTLSGADRARCGGRKSPVSRAFTRWLALFVAGAELDTDTCLTLHQYWLDSGIRDARWQMLDEYETSVIERLYRQKNCDWSDSFRPQDPESWWNTLCDGTDGDAAARRWIFVLCCRPAWILR
jgi:hypothetical protein